jgi:hypothetical protein
MSSETLIYIILAGIAALLLALFQYLYKSKKSKLNINFVALRFISIFAILLLIINPKFEKITYYNEKPNLIVAVDNSESIQHLNQVDNTKQFLKTIENDTKLNEHFNIEYYKFGNSFETIDSLYFKDSQSNLASVFNDLSQIYKNTTSPTLLITDGNQTYGSDYEYVSQKNYKQVVFPIILGDTVTYSDLKIQQLNVNKYSYLKNKFPIEIITVYNGNTNVSSQLIVTLNNTTVFKQNLNFSKRQNSQTINFTLPAEKVGVNTYVATLTPLKNEKNITNNTKPFAVDIIDQKTNVAIVSSIIHPDIGALKKSIESNEQRSVSVVSPNEYFNTMDNFQMTILYQPNTSFKSVFDVLDKSKSNKFVITGTQTQWSFLNSIQNNYTQEITTQIEEYQAEENSNYATFIVDNLSFSDFPPLQSEFGSISFNLPMETLLFKRVNNTIIEEPLLATFEYNGRREVLLIGEHIWKWRAQSYLNNKSFQQFDNFIGKLVQYLAMNKKRSRLNLEYESFYNGNGDIKILAQFFNKNYEFDARANINIILREINSDNETILPFILKQNNYQVDLSNFPSGEYNFTVSANSSEVTQSGHIKIFEYNVEQQFLNANVTKLQHLATNSLGASYFITNTTALISNLLSDSRFKKVQRSSKNVVPLIDFKYLLALIALSLAIEWFLRKYNGLI